MKIHFKHSMKQYVILLALVFILPVKGQNSTEKAQLKFGEDEKELLKNRWDKALGTFQFQIENSRINPQVNINILDKIEKNRDENKTVYIDYIENIKIMILPKSVIKNKFEKLSLFKYISTNTNKDLQN